MIGVAQTSPWHSIKENRHHDNTSCTEGNNIDKENRRAGTGGKPLCEHSIPLFGDLLLLYTSRLFALGQQRLYRLGEIALTSLTALRR